MDVQDLEEHGVPSYAVERILDKGIDELNPPQREAVERGLLDGESMVVSSPTASGKTLIATMAISNLLEETDRKKALYLVPLKALGSEKYQDYEEFFEGEADVELSVGDRDSSAGYLETEDLIIMTVEKLDAVLRHNPSWIKDVELVVVDEIHLLDSESRGPTLEVTLTRLMELMDFQLLGLSATINNSGELADWLDAELVESDYRPVDLKEGIYHDGELRFYQGDESSNHMNNDGGEFVTGREKLEEEREADGSEVETRQLATPYGEGTMNILSDTLQDGNQAITFVRSRKSAESEAEKLGKVVEGELSRREKQELEELSDRVENVLGNPTEQCRRLADAVEKGSAFHHAGLCVAGDTQILKPDGTIEQIENLVENPPDKVMGLKDGKIQPVKVLNTFEMGERPVLEIRTRTGNTLKVSRNHPLPTIGEGGIEWVKSKNLQEGEYVARPRTLDIAADSPSFRKLIPPEARVYRKYEATQEIAGAADEDALSIPRLTHYKRDTNISVGDFRQICEVAGERAKPHLGKVMSVGGQKPVCIPERVNEDICWLIGAIAGDGTIDGGSIGFGNSNPHLIKTFQGIVQNQFGRNTQIWMGNTGTTVASFTCKIVADILDGYFGISKENKLENLSLPDIPITDDLLGAYLSGLFDTDGTISPRDNVEGSPCIEYYSANEEFVKQIKTALLQFGIVAYKDTRDTQGRVSQVGDHQITSNRDIHRLTIYGTEQLRLFQSHIGFRHPAKREKLEEAISTNPQGGRGQLDVIPLGLGRRIQGLRQKEGIPLSELEPEVPKATLSRYENAITPMKRSTFQQLSAQLEDSVLEDIGTAEIYWDRIEEIEEEGEEKLYDLSTESENYIADGFIAHNTSEQRKLIEDGFRDNILKSISATPTLAMGVSLPAYRIIVRDVKRYTDNGLDHIPVLEYKQMAGRAGRPEHHDEGEAIAVAKNKGGLEDIRDRYVLGEPEKIWSKLAVEPVLRMHALGLIATRFASDFDQLSSFFSSTFYAHQYGDTDEVEDKLEEVVNTLEEYGFVEADENGLHPTKIGKRVSELYIDPYTAHHLLEAMERAREEEKVENIAYLQSISSTVEMKPRLRIGKNERADVEDMLAEAEDSLLEEPPEEWDFDYEEFLKSLKTGMMLKEWVEEKEEDRLMDDYGVTPGGIRSKVEQADWLLYACTELATLKEWDGVRRDVKRLRTRVKHGIREELLSLVKFKGVGRVRARRLHEDGIETSGDIRDASFNHLKNLVGKRTAKRLKNQVGQDEVFDKENILDYMGDSSG